LKIRKGCIVDLVYELKDSEGDVVESADAAEPMTYLHGYGEIAPGLEEELDGVEEGALLEIVLPPEKAYGDYNPDGIVAVPRSEFPADAEIVPGDWISVQIKQDEESDEVEDLEMKVLEISPDAITLDANHPLAGQEVTFDIRVLGVREASAEEIEARETEEEEEEEEEK
jgi:FKBP-type peptidyl-prolyl cis-trans isomerase SlyD